MLSKKSYTSIDDTSFIICESLNKGLKNKCSVYMKAAFSGAGLKEEDLQKERCLIFNWIFLPNRAATSCGLNFYEVCFHPMVTAV